MTRKTNRCPAFMEGRGTRCLKIAAVATLLLWCTQPMQAVANTNETQETADIQQQKVKTTGVVVDENGEPLIGVSVKVQGTATGTVTDLNGRFSIESRNHFSISSFSFLQSEKSSDRPDSFRFTLRMIVSHSL